MTTQQLSLPRVAGQQRGRRIGKALLWLVGLLLGGLLLFVLANLVLFGWMSRWGSTAAERDMALPGDELVAAPTLQSTKGITIQATPAQIYPWLLQLGVDRGGMYSYDWLENLFGLNVHTVDTIVPAYQQVQIGDFWRFTPVNYPLNPGPGLSVKELRPNEAVLLCFGLETVNDPVCQDTWQLVLLPQPDGSTRLLLRSRMAFTPTLPITATYAIQFIMERKMLLTLRDRAEGYGG